MPLPNAQLYGMAPNQQMGGANGGSFAQKQPVASQQMMRPTRPQMNRGSVGGVNRPKLGAGGARPTPQMGQALQPAQGLAPSYANPGPGVPQNRPLINTPPAGPSEQGYGRPAMPSPPSMPKLQPTGGVQMGAVNDVGTWGSMNPRSGMMGGMAARNFGNMGRPGMAFRPQTPEELRRVGIDRGQDMSWMDQPGAIQMGPQMGGGIGPGPNLLEQQIMAARPEAAANMGAVSDVGMSGYTPAPMEQEAAMGFRPMGEVGVPQVQESMMAAPQIEPRIPAQQQVRDLAQTGIGPSRRMMRRR